MSHYDKAAEESPRKLDDKLNTLRNSKCGKKSPFHSLTNDQHR